MTGGLTWQKRASPLTQFVDCSVDHSFLPDADDLLKKRDGSVLARHTILKADHFYRGIVDDLTIRLLGAPNFRKTDLSIYGVAQPNLSGLFTVLTLLGCGPRNPETKSCTWFNTREEPLVFVNDEPFVLRDQSSPAANIKAYAGISRERLEMMEERLKNDVIKEAMENGGLILVHDEKDTGKVHPCFVAIESVKTSSEVFADLLAKGYRVDYHRIPMSHGLSPMDPFIDEYIEVFRRVPIEHSVVFSCGLGIGRTTFGMLAGLLIRRAIHIERDGCDPFACPEPKRQDLLRLIFILEKALGPRETAEANQSAIQWILKRNQIIENLLAALQGNYRCVLDLVRVLEDGVACKKIVDYAVNRCEEMLNLRESILIGRVRHSIHVEDALETAIAFMERYWTLITLAGYLAENEKRSIRVPFSQWSKERPEIWNMFSGLRRDSNKLKVFLPITRLSGLKPGKNSVSWRSKEESEAAHAESTVIKNRSGDILVPHTIMKMDLWKDECRLPVEVEGALNFRQMKNAPVYAVAQPRLHAIKSIIQRVMESNPDGGPVCWINVREEPLVYIHEEPYVIRDKFASLRNLRSYSGIPTERLEQMESRLVSDVLTEASMYNNQVLVHAEDGEGDVFPVWEQIEQAAEVKTMAQIFQELAKDEFPLLQYHRIPVTAEDSPEPSDFDSILRIVSSVDAGSSIVVNCQIGAGRSTTGQVIVAQVISWLKRNSISGFSHAELSTKDTLHYRPIHSILRVIRYGLESKHALDQIIDDASAVVNLRLIVNEWRRAAEKASDPIEARKAKRKGLLALKRYCLLLLFQAYLNDNDPGEGPASSWMSEIETFSEYIARHPEFSKLLEELDLGKASLETLQTEEASVTEGHALTNEVANVIGARSGAVLGPLTILKYDHFPGCQKLSLPERLEGAPNFRQVSMPESSSSGPLFIYGMAMPMSAAIIDVLARMRASPNSDRNVLWISLREEPVIFVSGRPFVLRVVEDPVTNLEMTGIVSERVESMEERLKGDVLAEMSRFGEKVLLHEEELTNHGFDLVPIWEHVNVDDVATPAEVYSKISSQGYRLSYARIPITDEQAPIPTVFDLLFRLIWNKSKDTDLMFNCQMGRGRTTTGMVISTIIHLVRNGISVEDTTPVAETIDKNKSYLSGEYKLILHLCSVLEHGKQSKRFADFAVDLCSHIQNLREAILNFKLRLESSPAETGGPDIHEVGMNYLIRYFYLVVFSEFVMQRVARLGDEPAGEHEFSQWLHDRREITNLVAKPKLIDFS